MDSRIVLWKWAAIAGATVAGGLLACDKILGFEPPPKHSGTGTVTDCVPIPGTYPSATCDKSERDCNQPGCSIDLSCGSTSTCMPMSDNSGKQTLDFRIRALTVMSPDRLSAKFIQNVVVTDNVNLKLRKCGELGAGAFNWLVRVDRAAGTLTTGGAPPSPDPYGVGYCFYDHTTPEGLVVAPATTKVTLTGNTFKTDPIERLLVPIFLFGDINNVVVLPISQATISEATFTPDGNCIGSFNSRAVQSDCADAPEVCARWNTNGALGGYIPLEEADNVAVKDLNESLCAVLTSDKESTTPDGGLPKCARDASGKIRGKGDFCSTTKKPGDCQDSFWLTATFAASAVRIHDGATVAECKPGASTLPDAGSDAGDGGPRDASDQ